MNFGIKLNNLLNDRIGLRNSGMDFALVWAAFLVLIGLAGNEARNTTIIYTTGE